MDCPFGVADCVGCVYYDLRAGVCFFKSEKARKIKERWGKGDSTEGAG